MKTWLKSVILISVLVFGITNLSNAQQKEVIIEKKAKSPLKKDTSIKKEENITVIINGDKVTINGKETDLNDPRIKKIKRLPHREIVSITDSVEEFDPMMLEDMMEPASPAPPQNKAFLGVLTEKAENGVKVIELVDESPAAKAGIKENDIITSIDDQKVESSADLYNMIGKHNPSDKIKIAIERDNKKNTVEVTLEKNKNTSRVQSFSFGPGQNFKMPNMPNGSLRGFNFKMPNMPNLEGIARSSNKPKIGISVEDIEEGKGIKIKDIKKDSPAEKAGLKLGDIISKFDDHDVNEVNDIKWWVFEPGQSVKFEIMRGKEKKVIDVKIPKKINAADL